MAAVGELRALLGAAQFNTLPREMQEVLQQILQSNTDSLKADLEKTRVDGEHKVLQLQKKSEDLESKLAAFLAEQEKSESALCQYREQAAASSSLAARLTEENSNLASERDLLKRQIANAKAERDDMTGLSERRMTEVERLHARIRDQNEEINTAVAAKCEAQTKAEQLLNRESALVYKEKRFSDEREFLETQIKNLQRELERVSEEMLASKREAGLRSMELTQELAERCEELRAARRQEEIHLADVEAYRNRSEQLAEKLRKARDTESQVEENYRSELKAQTKLAELYKQNGEENVAKTDELAKAITELQNLLKESGEKYGRLETSMTTSKEVHKREMESRNVAIKALKKELEDANKLLETLKGKGSLDESMECMSPSASQASRLIKSGVSLTGIYTQMVNLSEELATEKEENKRLNGYMDQILHEIEERAPILKQQREDYEQAMAAVTGLTDSLEAAREEAELRRSEADEARRRLNTAERDRDRLDRMTTDLGKQVAVLVREVDAARGGGLVTDTWPMALDTSSTESVIEGRLLTFRDVTELQKKNIELLTVVRELTANRDQTEAELVEERTAEVRQELDTALRQVEELRSARERQQLMVENIIQQRDLYKSMCGAPKDSNASPVAVAKTPGSAQRKASETTPRTDRLSEQFEKQLADLKAEFDAYKKDKTESLKAVEKELSKIRDDLFEARGHAAKLASNEEYNSERFKIAQTNCNRYKKQIEELELRNKQLEITASKHENSVASLREELMTAIRKQSQAEFQVDQLSQENVHLKSNEARLSAEREVFQKERMASSQIMANLQQIQLNLERSNDESRDRLQSENTKLSREVELLQQKLDRELEHFRSSVRNWENTNKELREKADSSIASEKAALEQMNAMASTLDAIKEELKNKEEELQLAESRLAGRGQLNSSFSVEGEGKNRLRDVELLLAQTKQELKSVNTQLLDQKQRVEEFKMISEAAETRMLESSKAMADHKAETDGKIKALEEEKLAGNKLAEDVQEEMSLLREKIKSLESEAGVTGGELSENLKATVVQLTEAKVRIGDLEKQNKELSQRILSISEESRETQEKYERELLLHAKDIEKLNTIKADHVNHDLQMEEMDLKRRKAEEKLEEVNMSMLREGEARMDEIKVLKEQLEVAEKNNAAVLNQLEQLSSQLADVSASGRVADTSTLDASTVSNTSFSNRSLTEDESSNEQLLSIIKYLRREKEIVGGRLDVLQTEMIRVTSQLELAQKTAQDAHQALEMERANQVENSISAGKHAELIRKVESLSALTDSNRLLREEKEKLETIIDSCRSEAEMARESVGPLEKKVKELEENVAMLTVEKTAVESELVTWKKRSDQLVEKSFKLNPEELRRLEDQNAKLNKVVATMTTEKAQLNERLANQTEDLKKNKHSLASALQDAKRDKSEIARLQSENKSLSSSQLSAKNVQQNLSKQITDLKKEAEKNKVESTAAVNKLKQEVTELTSKLEQLQQGGKEVPSLKQELEKLKADYDALKGTAAIHEADKSKIASLKTLGRKLKESNTKLEKELNELKAETAAKTESEAQAEKVTLDEANKLLEELTKEHEIVCANYDNLKLEIEGMKKTSEAKEQRAREVLISAKGKIDKVNEENEALKLKVASYEERGSSSATDAENEAMRAAFNSQMNKMKDDKNKLDAEHAELLKEKDLLKKQVEQLQQELAANASASQSVAKPVAVAGVVQDKQQQGVRKQAQPQAHIPPHRHQPREESHHHHHHHRPPTQTASIRPMTQQRAAANQAVVLPTSQPVTLSLPEVATVQPTVSVSPTISSAAVVPPTNQPSTSQASGTVDSSAVELVTEVTTEVSEAGGEEPPLAVVSPRHDLPLSSTIGPSSSQPGNTAHMPTSTSTASIPPSLKRSRDSVETECVEDQPGPSGYQKRLRTSSAVEEAATVSATEDLEEGETEDSQDEGTDAGERGRQEMFQVEGEGLEAEQEMEEGEIDDDDNNEEEKVEQNQDVDEQLAEDEDPDTRADPDLEDDLVADPELDVLVEGDVAGDQVIERDNGGEVEGSVEDFTEDSKGPSSSNLGGRGEDSNLPLQEEENDNNGDTQQVASSQLLEIGSSNESSNDLMLSGGELPPAGKEEEEEEGLELNPPVDAGQLSTQQPGTSQETSVIIGEKSKQSATEESLSTPEGEEEAASISSSGRSGEHQSRVARTPIVWSDSTTQPSASTSPQRNIVRTGGPPQIVRSVLRQAVRDQPVRGGAARGATAAAAAAARGAVASRGTTATRGLTPLRGASRGATPPRGGTGRRGGI